MITQQITTTGYAASAFIGILTIIAWWKVFKKAGEPGWKSIVPLYDGHVLYGLCWKSIYFWISTICLLASTAILQFSPNQTPALLPGILAVVLFIVSGVISIKFNFKLSRAFGHGVGFGIGLWLLHTIFSLILGFGKSEYVGNASEI